MTPAAPGSLDRANPLDPSREGRRVTHLDLPDTDGIPVNNPLELPQSVLLTDALEPILAALYPGENYFVGEDVGVYWKLVDPPLDGCKCSDWFYVPNVPLRLDGRHRRSYVMWEEKVSPRLVVEYVSGDGKDERDATPHTGKFWVYERGIRAKYYAIIDHVRDILEVYKLVRGRYARQRPNRRDRYPIDGLGVELGVWAAVFRGYDMSWLRAWTPAGVMIPCFQEQTEAERSRAEAERSRAEAERSRAEAERSRADDADRRADDAVRQADRLAAKLRELGLDPDAL